MQYGKHTVAACGALLCSVLLLLPLGIGQTQARYEDTVSWKGVYQVKDPILQSNFLIEGGRTVLLKDWNVSTTSYRTLGIQLATDGQEAVGALRCEVDSDLITAKVDEEAYNIGKTKNHATLTLTATQQAQNLTEPTDVTIRVSWIPEGREAQQPTEWADFQVTLLPQMQSEESSEPEGNQQAAGVLDMACPGTFALAERLAIRLTLPQGADRIELSYDGGDFPENTGYRINAEKDIVLAEEMTISAPAAGMQEMLVVLDFSWTMNRQNSFYLSAAAYAGETEIAAANVTVSTDRKPLKVETDSEAIVMGANAQVTLPISGDLDGLVWELQQLVRNGDQILYAASDALTIRTQTPTGDGADSAALVLTNDYTRAPAGTYRLTVQRVHDGVVLSSFEIPVFICY